MAIRKHVYVSISGTLSQIRKKVEPLTHVNYHDFFSYTKYVRLIFIFILLSSFS